MTLSHDQARESLETFELKHGLKVRLDVLKQLVPDTSTALFFGKAYELDYRQLSNLLQTLFKTTVIQTLLGEGDSHSSELQDYIIDVVPDAELQAAGIQPGSFDDPKTAEFLPELFEQLEVEVAASIKALIAKLDGALEMIQVKQGAMVFGTLAKLNRKRANVIGTYEAQIKHPKQAKNLVIFDVSASVSKQTVEKIVNEVVGLTYKANAALAVVSDHTFYWEPGTFTVADVLSVAEFSGTRYETLASLFEIDSWSTVITIADYDSYCGVAPYFQDRCHGRVQQVLDISLVNRGTYLAEVIGSLADEVRPLLVAHSRDVLGRNESDTDW
jgi:hypothetical protein